MRNEKTKQETKMRNLTFTRDDIKRSYYGGLVNIKEDHCERLEIVTFNFEKDNKPGVLVWKGKQTKPLQYYKFASVEKQIEHVQKLMEAEVRELEAKKALAEKKKAAKCPFKVGDLLYGTWGYDQTNVEAYQVVGLKGKSSVVLKAVCQEIVKGSQGYDCCNVKPVKDSFLSGKEIVKRATTYNGENWTVKMHYSCHLRLWEGQEIYKSWYA